MSTITAPAANPDMGPTLPDHEYQAASAAKLNSFADAYDANPEQANHIAATLSKDYPDAIRLANICDSGLVNQMVFFLEVPGSSPKLAVLSCPFPTARGTGAVFAGSLGNSMDIICPVTIRMRDVKGQCITLASARRNPIRFNLPTSGTDPLLDEGPDPVNGTFAEPPVRSGSIGFEHQGRPKQSPRPDSLFRIPERPPTRNPTPLQPGQSLQ